jgi:hypothetical protein
MVMPPKAYISHQIAQRLRIKIPEKKKDADFFSWIENRFSECPGFEELQVNSLTGSLLFMDEKEVDLEIITAHAEEKQLFVFAKSNPNPSNSQATTVAPRTVAHTIVEPFQKLDRQVHKFSEGHMNLATLGFLFLLSVGIYQIKEGKMIAIPWYVAFWYAFNLFLFLRRH